MVQSRHISMAALAVYGLLCSLAVGKNTVSVGEYKDSDGKLRRTLSPDTVDLEARGKSDGEKAHEGLSVVNDVFHKRDAEADANLLNTLDDIYTREDGLEKTDEVFHKIFKREDKAEEAGSILHDIFHKRDANIFGDVAKQDLQTLGNIYGRDAKDSAEKAGEVLHDIFHKRDGKDGAEKAGEVLHDIFKRDAKDGADKAGEVLHDIFHKRDPKDAAEKADAVLKGIFKREDKAEEAGSILHDIFHKRDAKDSADKAGEVLHDIFHKKDAKDSADKAGEVLHDIFHKRDGKDGAEKAGEVLHDIFKRDAKDGADKAGEVLHDIFHKRDSKDAAEKADAVLKGIFKREDKAEEAGSILHDIFHKRDAKDGAEKASEVLHDIFKRDAKDSADKAGEVLHDIFHKRDANIFGEAAMQDLQGLGKYYKRDASSPQQASFDSNENFRSMNLDSIFTLLNDVNLFYSYVREDVPFVSQLADTDQDVIIIAPTNEAITQLGKKPWEFPRDIEALEQEGSSEETIDAAIHSNVLDFVRSRVILFEDSSSFFKEEDDYTVVRSMNMEKQSADNGEANAGDILVKSVNGSFFVASSKDREFHEVKNVEMGVNGVVLVVDSCLTWPGF